MQFVCHEVIRGDGATHLAKPVSEVSVAYVTRVSKPVLKSAKLILK
jgi:hypothetical protein